MSGDHEPREYLAGAVRALRADPELRTQLVGDPQLISAALAGLPEPVRSRATVVGASQVVSMQEKPREAIRHKKQSSMRVAVDLVQAGTACACVSAGNTGALTAIAHFVLRSEEHTSELQSRTVISYAVFCLKKKKKRKR